MRTRTIISLFLGATLLASPALADRRGFSVTSFTRMRVEGPVTVVLTSGTSPSAYAEGDRAAIDRLRVESSGDQLMISIDRTNWTGDSRMSGGNRAVLLVGGSGLETLSVIGAGDVSVDRVAGNRLSITLTGAGKASIGEIDVNQLALAINGAGNATLSGRAKQARVRSQGEGVVDGAALGVDDLETLLIGAGEIRLHANRSARNMLKGSGRIVISGKPACTGSSEGSGEVLCGTDAE